jgi:hypothetical protein
MVGTAYLGRDDAEARERWVAAGKPGQPGPGEVFGGLERAEAQLRALEAVGVERAMLRQPAHEDLDSVTLLGELARALA